MSTQHSSTFQGDAPVVNLLVIGPGAERLAQSLKQSSGDQLHVRSCVMPAQGIRAFEQTPPDALILLGKNKQGAAVRALVHAIISRPLGPLIPMMVMSPSPESLASPEEIADELQVNAWLPLDSPTHYVLQVLADIVGFESFLGEPLPPERPAPKNEPPIARRKPSSQVRVDAQPPGALLGQETAPTREVLVNLEQGQVPFPETYSAVAKVQRESIFPVKEQPQHQGDLSEEQVRRKLKEVRHEDYYTILEVRRGAETPVIKDSFMRLAARYNSARLDFAIVHNCYQELAEIRDALEDAWAVLGDNELRRLYLSAVSQK